MDLEPTPSQPQRVPRSRRVLGLVCGAVAIGYVVGIVLVGIPQERRLDAPALIALALGLILVALLSFPEIVTRFKRLELQGFKLEMLEDVKDQQALQKAKLGDIDLMVPLLIPEGERKHLLNLVKGKTHKYKGSQSVREELRRLCNIQLLRRRPPHTIAELKDDLQLDIANLVELTAFGERWARRIQQLEAPDEVETAGG